MFKLKMAFTDKYFKTEKKMFSDYVTTKVLCSVPMRSCALCTVSLPEWKRHLLVETVASVCARLMRDEDEAERDRARGRDLRHTWTEHPLPPPRAPAAAESNMSCQFQHGTDDADRSNPSWRRAVRTVRWCPEVEVSRYVTVLSPLPCDAALYLAAGHQKGSGSRTPAGAITYSRQWLCEQREDFVRVRAVTKVTRTHVGRLFPVATSPSLFPSASPGVLVSFE